VLVHTDPNHWLSSVIGVWCASTTAVMYLHRHALAVPPTYYRVCDEVCGGANTHFKVRHATVYLFAYGRFDCVPLNKEFKITHYLRLDDGIRIDCCVCLCMVKHDLDALVVDEDTIRRVGKWFNGLDKPKTPAKEPAKFSDSGDKKTWFDNISAYMEQVIGEAGTPVSYVVKDDDDSLADEGFGMPTFSKEMRCRGRHDGMFWVADNSTVSRALPWHDGLGSNPRL
jgi:hypothetical protein